MNLRNFASVDLPLMAGVFILLAFSLVTIYSIEPTLFRSQLIFTIFGLFVFLIFTQIDYRAIRFYSKYIYIISLVLLVLVLLIGTESRGSVRWIEFLGFRAQFSEILKPFLAISLAHLLVGLNSYSFKNFISILLLLAPLVILVFIQPDLGNSLIYFFVTLGTLLVYGFPLRFFMFGFFTWFLTLPVFWIILHDYQRDRILSFLDPGRDPLNTSYNTIQAVIAVGSGMLLGRGLGQGTQVELLFLPEQHTDFIFATIAEELGFIGSAIVVFSFSFILYRIFLIIRSSKDKFSKTFSIAVFMIIFVHFFINVGMNIGIVPVVGITLPFVSYGGSSLLSSFILLGLLFSANKKEKEEVLEIG